MQFGEFFERYIEGQSVANREKPSSIDSKRRVWKNYLRERYDKMRLNEVKAAKEPIVKHAFREHAPIDA